MKVSPKTEREIAEMRALPKGWYPFTIDTAEEKLSKKAAEKGETEPNMMELNLRVYRDSGYSFQKDWLMEGQYSSEKLRNCAVACGVLNEYEAGELSGESLKGREGYVKIGIETKGDFAGNNKVLDYAKEPPKSKDEAKPAPPNSDPELDGDDIPF